MPQVYHQLHQESHHMPPGLQERRLSHQRPVNRLTSFPSSLTILATAPKVLQVHLVEEIRP